MHLKASKEHRLEHGGRFREELILPSMHFLCEGHHYRTSILIIDFPLSSAFTAAERR